MAAIGIVSTQAQTMRPATPHLTADSRRVDADADDCARDRVRGRDGNAGERRAKERDRAGGLGAETADRLELGDPRSHRVDNAPAAGKRAGGNGGVGGQHYPERNLWQLAARARPGSGCRRLRRP